MRYGVLVLAIYTYFSHQKVKQLSGTSIFTPVLFSFCLPADLHKKSPTYMQSGLIKAAYIVENQRKKEHSLVYVRKTGGCMHAPCYFLYSNKHE